MRCGLEDIDFSLTYYVRSVQRHSLKDVESRDCCMFSCEIFSIKFVKLSLYILLGSIFIRFKRGSSMDYARQRRCWSHNKAFPLLRYTIHEWTKSSSSQRRKKQKPRKRKSKLFLWQFLLCYCQNCLELSIPSLWCTKSFESKAQKKVMIISSSYRFSYTFRSAYCLARPNLNLWAVDWRTSKQASKRAASTRKIIIHVLLLLCFLVSARIMKSAKRKIYQKKNCRNF